MTTPVQQDTPQLVESLINIQALHEWEDNYNQGDVMAIARAILRYGYNGAVRVWRDGVVMAGNHTTKALKYLQFLGPKQALQKLGFVPQGQDPDPDSIKWFSWPPKHITEFEGDWYVRWVDVSHLDYPEAVAFAIADNRTAEKAAKDETKLAELLKGIKEDDPTAVSATGYSDSEVAAMLNAMLNDSETSDGSLLSLVDVTVEDPKHQVERGQVWHLGEHILICADVMRDWAVWSPYLAGESDLFIPYPGPFVPLSNVTESNRLVMVQPDTYIAGHMLDRYTEIHGEESAHHD